MTQEVLNIVAADDDEMSLELMVHSLEHAGYKTTGFSKGDLLYEFVQRHANDTDVVILDKIMPDLDGVEILKRMKADQNLKNIPVIIQTGDVGLQQMQESIDAGAYYYLTKPYEPSAMVSLVKAASRSGRQRFEVENSIETADPSIKFLQQAVFKIRKPEQVTHLAASISSIAEQKKEVALVFTELLLNAIEHGNLGIGYQRKGELLEAGKFDQEVKRLLTLPENIRKNVAISYMRSGKTVKLRIHDNGKGFDWKEFTKMDATRFVDLNGRGIAYASIVGIPLHYSENGSQVEFSFQTV